LTTGFVLVSQVLHGYAFFYIFFIFKKWISDSQIFKSILPCTASYSNTAHNGIWANQPPQTTAIRSPPRNKTPPNFSLSLSCGEALRHLRFELDIILTCLFF
jgi:hypothetical protein